MKKLYELPDGEVLEFLDKLGICGAGVRDAFEKHLPSEYIAFEIFSELSGKVRNVCIEHDGPGWLVEVRGAGRSQKGMRFPVFLDAMLDAVEKSKDIIADKEEAQVDFIARDGMSAICSIYADGHIVKCNDEIHSSDGKVFIVTETTSSIGWTQAAVLMEMDYNVRGKAWEPKEGTKFYVYSPKRKTYG